MHIKSEKETQFIEIASRRLSKIIKKSGTTQAQLAERTHIGVGRLRAWVSKSNSRFPNPFLLRKITSALGYGSTQSKYHYVVTGYHADKITELLMSLDGKEKDAALQMLSATKEVLWSRPLVKPYSAPSIPIRGSEVALASALLRIEIGAQIKEISELIDRPEYIVKRWLSSAHSRNEFPSVYELDQICRHVNLKPFCFIGIQDLENDIDVYMTEIEEPVVRGIQKSIEIIFNQVYEVYAP